MARIRIVILMISFCIPAFHQSASALSCGNYRYPRCDGPDLQYAAGLHDKIHFSTAERHTDCGKGAFFMKSANVKAQLDVGAGSKARKANLDFRDWRPTALSGGPVSAVAE